MATAHRVPLRLQPIGCLTKGGAMLAQIVGTLLTWSTVMSVQTILGPGLRPGSPAGQAFEFFAALPITTADSALASIRPKPVGAEEKRRALAELPTEGELRPTAGDMVKLKSLRRVLIYHKREAVFEVKVIDVPQAAVVLHARSVVLVSRPALRLVSALELQAIVAHEIGHEFFWDQEQARTGSDAHRRHELELRCDAIAILTLLHLGLDPASLVSAAQKLTRFNEQLGMTTDFGGYPTTAEREQFARAIIDLHRHRGLNAVETRLASQR
jgi:hypothetical protein